MSACWPASATHNTAPTVPASTYHLIAYPFSLTHHHHPTAARPRTTAMAEPPPQPLPPPPPTTTTDNDNDDDDNDAAPSQPMQPAAKAPATEVERLLAKVGGGFPPAVAREAHQLLRKLAVKMKPGTLGKVRVCA